LLNRLFSASKSAAEPAPGVGRLFEALAAAIQLPRVPLGIASQTKIHS
jgi:hypothetical protein